jgi:hypothetical protein
LQEEGVIVHYRQREAFESMKINLEWFV